MELAGSLVDHEKITDDIRGGLSFRAPCRVCGMIDTLRCLDSACLLKHAHVVGLSFRNMREEDVYLLSSMRQAGTSFTARITSVWLRSSLILAPTARYSLSLKTRCRKAARQSAVRAGLEFRYAGRNKRNPTLPSALVFSADADHRRSNLPPPCNRKGLCFAGLQLPPGEEQQPCKNSHYRPNGPKTPSPIAV